MQLKAMGIPFLFLANFNNNIMPEQNIRIVSLISFSMKSEKSLGIKMGSTPYGNQKDEHN